MDILNLEKQKQTSKPEIEQVVKEKMEFTLLGKYAISNGFKLFSCNPANDYEVKLIEIKYGTVLCLELTTEGWIYYDPENAHITIDSKVYYFEAFNMKSALNMVKRFREGKIKDLFNLKKPKEHSINIFKPL